MYQPIETERLLTARQAASRMRVAVTTFYKLKEAGKLPPPLMIGKRAFYLREQIDGMEGITLRGGKHGLSTKGRNVRPQAGDQPEGR